MPQLKSSQSSAKTLQDTNPPSPIITIQDARLKLGHGPSSVQVLNGINLEVSGGTSIAVVGPSGSGKSTLLMVLAGLERIDHGKIIVAQTNYEGLSEDQLAAFRGRKIGIVFQSFHLIPNMTALENVAVPLEMAGVQGAFSKARDELASVGLSNRLNHYPSQMSGGEQQRVAIARALAPDPAIVIADEPTGNLDETTGSQIADLMFEKQTQRNTTLVLVTHDLKLAQRCERIVGVRDGEIEEQAKERPRS